MTAANVRLAVVEDEQLSVRVYIVRSYDVAAGIVLCRGDVKSVNRGKRSHDDLDWMFPKDEAALVTVQDNKALTDMLVAQAEKLGVFEVAVKEVLATRKPRTKTALEIVNSRKVQSALRASGREYAAQLAHDFPDGEREVGSAECADLAVGVLAWEGVDASYGSMILSAAADAGHEGAQQTRKPRRRSRKV